MVEQVETKSAFINKKYNNEDRLKKDEEELEQLMAEQKGEAVELNQNQRTQKRNLLKNVMVIYADISRKKKKNLLLR